MEKNYHDSCGANWTREPPTKRVASRFLENPTSVYLALRRLQGSLCQSAGKKKESTVTKGQIQWAASKETSQTFRLLHRRFSENFVRGMEKELKVTVHIGQSAGGGRLHLADKHANQRVEGVSQRNQPNNLLFGTVGRSSPR